jgi:hypothetical protein
VDADVHQLDDAGHEDAVEDCCEAEADSHEGVARAQELGFCARDLLR